MCAFQLLGKGVVQADNRFSEHKAEEQGRDQENGQTAHLDPVGVLVHTRNALAHGVHAVGERHEWIESLEELWEHLDGEAAA